MKYKDAIADAFIYEMERNKNIFITGIAVDYPSGIFGSLTKVQKKFGSKRVFDAPAMENAITGIAVGAATQGMRPVIVHPRVDFMFLSFDMLIQLAAKWRYMFGGNGGDVPIVIRAIIGRGWGQGSTHSQSTQSMLAHIPGLNVVMPTYPSDVRGIIISALRGKDPTVILEHRSLYEIDQTITSRKPLPFGQSKIINKGTDITIVSTSFMTIEASEAVKKLKEEGISVELIDLISIRPLDEKTILRSVNKTGRLICVDTSWELCGVASEIIALATEKSFNSLISAPKRITLPNCPSPVSNSLEKVFYPTSETIFKACQAMMGKKIISEYNSNIVDNFKGPY
jgi:acetoin:2,6-dichlorophenolindophenol oxidoreductase subunit beta